MKAHLLILFILFFGTKSTAQTTRYVSTLGSGTKDGLSWANASSDIQAMINASSSGQQVFVAIGTYKPLYKANAVTGSQTPNDRDNAFVIKNGGEALRRF